MARQFRPGQLQTGSLYNISSSYAVTASYSLTAQTLLGSVVSASYAATASFAPDYVLSSATSSMLQPYVLTSSTSSMSVLSSSYTSTASYIETAQTASYVLQAVSSSFATTASYAASASHAVTSSHAVSALSSSYSLTSTSASYAHTASYINPLVQNVIITGSIYIPDNNHSIYFSGSSAASRLVWNDTDGTLDLGLKGGNVTLQIGQEQVVRVVNKTGANLLESEYKVARIRRVDEGGAQGQRLAIVLAQANNDANSVDTLGIVTENIDNNQEGFITNSGLVRNINTTGTLQGETWTDGDLLYLSPTTPGALTTTKPQAPDHTVVMGYVVYAHNSQGKIFVKVDNGYEIDELHNVRITTASLAAGQLLVRSGSNATGVWINTNQLTGSYGLIGSLTATQITASGLYADNTYISGSLTVIGNSTFIGSSSFLYVTASQLAISSSFISVNVFEPLERFGGLKVYDSGSSLATASLAWDSLHNHWVYQNIDGATYTGGMLLSGPRNTGSIGDEPNLTTWFIPRSDGGDHLDNSQIFSSESIHIVTGSLTVTQGITGSLSGTATNASTASYVQTAQTASYVLQAVSASFASTASYILQAISSSFASTASYVQTAQTASYILQAVSSSFASTASYAETAQTASYVLQAISASYATTASHALNSISSSFATSASYAPDTTFPYTGSAIVSGSLLVTGSFSVLDVGGFNNINSAVRSLYGGTGTLSVDWTNRLLSNASGVTVVDWRNTRLIDTSTTRSIDWQNRTLLEATQLTVLDWANGQQLWGTRLAIDWRNRKLHDTSPILSADWAQRTLHDTSTTQSVNWNNRYLSDTSANTAIDWNGRRQYDTSTSQSINWGARTLIDSIEGTSVDWELRQANDSSAILSVDWLNRQLYDSAGSPSVDWSNRQLVDAGGNSVFAWDASANSSTTLAKYYNVQDIADLDAFSQLSSTTFAGLTQNISGEVIPTVGVIDAGVSMGNLVYLNSDGIWYKTDQTSVSSSYMLGVCVETAAGKERVFLEGNIGFTTSSVADSPLVTGTNFYGVPIYISGSNGAMSTEKPTSGIIRIVGHAFYNSVTTPTNWLMKFRPSNDWYEI